MKKQNLYQLNTLLGLFLLLISAFSCTTDRDNENLYPEVVADFTYTYDEFTRTVTFVNTSTGGDQYEWDFGDGTGSDEKSPEHYYAADGTYVVKLTVTNAVGTKNVKSESIQTIQIFPLLLPIDFESANINYEFTDFGGAVGSKVANPYISGINTSAQVGKLVKTNNAETWAGSILTLFNPINFGTNNGFKVKVWSPKANSVVKLKLENLDDSNINYEVDAVTTAANQWEELSFNFTGMDFTKAYQKVVIFFDFGNVGDNSEYYFDDIQLADLGPLTIIAYEQNFENFTAPWTDFGGAVTTVVDNPVSGGINTSAKVGETTKNPPETWAGSFYAVDGSIPFNIAKKFKLKVYSPVAGAVVKIKVEKIGDGSVAHEVDAVTTVANQWEELTFDFSAIDASHEYGNIVLFFNFGEVGTGEKYYFDDLILTNQ